MPTNHFFSKGTINEQYLYEDLVIEALQIYGFDVYYMPRTLVDKDQLFGEDALSKFDDSYLIEMYMDTVEGFQGEKEIITRFGLEVRDETIFTVARRTWLNLVSMDANLVTSIRPNEGDWIYMPTVQRLFEISFVDKDDPFYQVDNLPVYKLYARTVEYSDERLDTGIDAIDNIETKYSTDELQWQILGEQNAATLYNCKFLLERGTDLYADGLIELENATNSPPAAGQLLIGQDETPVVVTTLSSGVVVGAQSITLASVTNLPATGTVTISADQTNLAETVDYTAINSTTLTIPGGLAYNHDPATIVTSVPAEPNAIFDAILMEDSDSENSFFIINEDYSLISAEPLADNSWIEDAITGTGSGFETADAVLDFTERNPFGEPD